jgi:hypothetical protein
VVGGGCASFEEWFLGLGVFEHEVGDYLYVVGGVRTNVKGEHPVSVFGIPLVSQGEMDYYIAKLNAATGEAVWAKTFGGVRNWEMFNSVVADEAGNLYAVATFGNVSSAPLEMPLKDGSSTSLAVTNNWGEDYLLVKFNKDGEILWATSIGSKFRENGTPDVTVGEDGNPVICGVFNAANGNLMNESEEKREFYIGEQKYLLYPEQSKESALVKLNSTDGSVMWSRYFTGTGNQEVLKVQAVSGSNAFQLADLFAKSKHLGDRVTFAFENKVEYERFVAYLKEGKLGEAHKLLKKNIEDVWYQEDSEVSTFWKLAGYALQIADCVNRGVKSDGDIQDLVEWYVGSGQEADKAYRRYLTDSQEVVSLPTAVKTMTQYVEGLYADFTERSVKEYQMRAGEIKNHEQLRNQGCIDIVYPALKEGKRVALFFVDAFRYEMGKCFADSMMRNEPDQVKIGAKLSFLPSVTRFGMAAHLGHVKVVEQNGKLQPSVDGRVIITPDDRLDYLQQKTHVDGIGTSARFNTPYQGVFVKNPEYAGQEDEYDFILCDKMGLFYLILVEVEL